MQSYKYYTYIQSSSMCCKKRLPVCQCISLTSTIYKAGVGACAHELFWNAFPQADLKPSACLVVTESHCQCHPAMTRKAVGKSGLKYSFIIVISGCNLLGRFQKFTKAFIIN